MQEARGGGHRVGPKSRFISDGAFSYIWSEAVCHFSQVSNVMKMVFLTISLVTGYGVDGGREREACEVSKLENATGM